MATQFYNKYKDLSKEKLIEIILSPADYQPEAISVAKQIIIEKGWENDLQEKIKENNIKNIKEEELVERDIKEKAEYYKNAVEFKNQGNFFQVRIADIPKFEASLIINNIEFFRENKNLGAQLDVYPTQTYFFKNNDIEVVDKISKEIGLVATPYADIKPFFRFEVIVLLIVIAVVISFILLF